MVWYGMVWYGMVWYGMVWYGMVWYGMVWYGYGPTVLCDYESSFNDNPFFQVYETAAKLGPLLQVGEKFVYKESSDTSLPEADSGEYALSDNSSKSSFV